MNPESDNAAVKLALAETHVIQETKTFLEQHGVDLSALDTSGPRRPPRSDRIVLVKNIPYGTSAADVRALFEPHGELRRVLVPPAGTLAVVEFVNPDEGRKAFRAVAYRRLGNSIIYLEKGPEGMFITDEPIADAPAAVPEPVIATAVAPIVVPDSAAGGADEAPLSAGTTLFVKNLSFSTTLEKLTQVVRHLPDFAFARIQTKPDPARPGARLSMGYGFVGFRTPDGARRGLKSLDGLVLDGHKLVVKWAGRGAEEGEGAEDKEKVKARTTKMIVKNVPFEATKKDIREGRVVEDEIGQPAEKIGMIYLPPGAYQRSQESELEPDLASICWTSRVQASRKLNLPVLRAYCALPSLLALVCATCLSARNV